MFRFAIKVGLAAGAIYYLKEEGVWKDSPESLKVYDKLNTTLEPYVKQIKEQVPFELPKLTYDDQSRYAVREYWNKGVSSTFQFLTEVPHKTSKLTESTVSSVLQNPEVKKIFEPADVPQKK